MKKYAVIVAGGSGIRMGSELPKQFLLIHNKPILWHTIQVFLKSYKDLHMIVVLPEAYFETGVAICEEINAVHPIQTITGGTTRFHSVQKGLSLITEQSVVFVHDAVRCLITPSLIHFCYEEAIQFGSAVPCIDSRDSVRILDGKEHSAIERTRIKLMQTPQTFISDILLPAYETMYQEGFTDETAVVEFARHPVHLVAGEENNIKITNRLDLAIAENLLNLPQHP